MKNRICLLLSMFILIINTFSFVIADDKVENYKMTDYEGKYGFFHAIMYGTTIEFVEGAGTVTISDSKVMDVEGSQLKALQPGICDVSVAVNSKSVPFAFFVWNYKLKGSQIDLYSDANLTQKAGTMKGEAYLVCKEEGNALKIEEYLFSTGSSDIYVKGKYISKSNSATYLEDNSKGKQTKLYFSLSKMTVVRPVTTTVEVSGQAGTSRSYCFNFFDFFKFFFRDL